MRYILALVIALCLTSSTLAQDADTYNPGSRDEVTEPVNPKKTEKPNRAEAARKRFAEWQARKRSCLSAAGLKEGVDFRVSPNDPLTFQIADRVWLTDKYDWAAIEKCQ